MLALVRKNILKNIYMIMECKNGRAMVKYGNRQPIYKSNTFCLIKADDYRSKNTAIWHVQLSVRSKNHEMGESYLIPYADSEELYQPVQHCNATGVFRQ